MGKTSEWWFKHGSRWRVRKPGEVNAAEDWYYETYVYPLLKAAMDAENGLNGVVPDSKSWLIDD